MKKLLVLIVSLCVLAPFAIAQSNDGNPIVIIIGQGGDEGTTPVHRAPALIPIQAAYYPSFSTILVNFMYDMGQVVVEIENQTTGEFIQSTINATQGVHPFSLPNIAGDYVITFTLPSGRVYSGAFEID